MDNLESTIENIINEIEENNSTCIDALPDCPTFMARITIMFPGPSACSRSIITSVCQKSCNLCMFQELNGGKIPVGWITELIDHFQPKP